MDDLDGAVLRSILRFVDDSVVCSFVCRKWRCSTTVKKEHVIWYSELLAKRGHLNLLIWAKSKGCPITSGAIDKAAGNGRMQVLKWLETQNLEQISGSGGVDVYDLEIAKWLVANGYLIGENTANCAARMGNLELLEWAIDNGSFWPLYIIGETASFGHTHIMKWYKNRGYQWSNVACCDVVEFGNFASLKWLRNNGCPWGKGVCKMAAHKGYLGILQWAVDRGCPWDPAKCREKAKSEDVIRWIDNRQVENQFDKLDENIIAMILYLVDDRLICSRVCKQWRDVVRFAVADDNRTYLKKITTNGYISILKWFKCEGYAIYYVVIKTAVKCNQQHIIRWYGKNFKKNVHEMEIAARYSYISTIQVMHMAKWKPDAMVCANAARAGRLDVLKWMVDECYPWDKTTIDMAVLGDHPHIVKWAVRNGCPCDKLTINYARILHHTRIECKRTNKKRRLE